MKQLIHAIAIFVLAYAVGVVIEKVFVGFLGSQVGYWCAVILALVIIWAWVILRIRKLAKQKKGN